MASVSDEIPPTQDNKIKSVPSGNNVSVENGELDQVKTTSSTKTSEGKKERVEEGKQNQSSNSALTESNKSLSTTFDVQEEKSTCIPSKNISKENINRKLQEQEEEQEQTSSKSRSANFTSTISKDDTDIPKLRTKNSINTRSSYSSSKSSRRPVDFIDTLVESYKLETTNNTSPTREEKKYAPKTNRSRLNPNWREHRTRRLMNKLEELSLWDREEELKASQAQSLREQKWEQIQDRQRNHDLCLQLMRQRHESEMESAVKLDRAATGINDENTSATIATAMNLASPSNVLAYDLPTPPQTLKRRVRIEEEKATELKTPIGRYRQFEKNMNNKLDKINQKLQPDREIMRAYSPYHTSIPPTTVPLFSETYSALLSVPDTSPSSNKYNQYRYGVASYLHQPQHASSPDYETRLRSYSNRDVRVPLKEQANEYNSYNDDNIDDYNRPKSIDDDYYKKYRSNTIDNDYYTKYRSTPMDDDYYKRYRPNSIDNDYRTKYRSSSIDDGYHLKYRSNPIDENYYPKYRANPIDDDYYPKYRSISIDEDYNPKYRANLIDVDYNPKYRANPIDDDDDDYGKYRTNPIDDNYYTKYRSTLSSNLDYSPPRRTTTLASPTASSLYDYSTVTNTPREHSFIHSRPPTSTSIHLRSLNDDLNAITRFSTETSKKILQNIGDSTNDLSIKPRSISSSSTSAKKYTDYNDQDFDNENFNYNSSHNHSSKTMHQPIEILSLSSTR
ncbi:unnamed protein product [Rotaria sp. Silwood1]|nr:unnamed protein product [Rotaria sp. Silwood1]CAF3324101.1 unnamed protein product [Rotaria sp. Silwood1]CAF3336711.1 unnamed protein product [Rotaria sp. Silwood1]CAF3341070.1 unnamed protein product [Rotaria sp. Silwood1]CAF4513139.1 unnamed protein product [Rotaria sp. Silwood1]